MSNNALKEALNPKNYSEIHPKEHISKSIIKRVLELKNEDREQLNQKYERSGFEMIKPYSFLDNTSICDLIKSLVLYKLDTLGEIDIENVDRVANYLYNEWLHTHYYYYTFHEDEISCSEIVRTHDASYHIRSSKDDEGNDVDIVEIKNVSGGHNGGTDEKIKLVFNKQGLHTKTVIEKPRIKRAWIFERDKKNIYILKVTFYPAPHDTEDKPISHEIDIDDMRNLGTDPSDWVSAFVNKSGDPVLDYTKTHPLMIPSGIRIDYLEDLKKPLGELKIDSKEVERRVKRDSQNPDFKKAIKEMGLLPEIER